MHSDSIEHILKRSDFLAVSRNGKRYVTPAFIIQALATAPNEPKRFGVVASRKVGGAVQRNRAKRRLRALANSVLIDHGIPGFDYVLIARHDILNRNFALMRQDLEKGLSHLHKV